MIEIKRFFTTTLELRLREKLNFLQVVIGPRQVGKTTGVRQIVREWQGPSLLVTADEINTPTAEWLTLQWERGRQLGDNALLAIDEVQKIPGWSSTVKRLFDQDREARRLKVVLLGSASLNLAQGLQESLAGRFELIPAPHWNLAECRRAFGWGLDDFLKFGGYPAAAELANDIVRWRSYVRDAIIEPVLIRDILGLVHVGKPALFRQTCALAMSYPAQEVSLQKLLGQLQENGNVTTIKHYLELLEGAFFVKLLYKFSGSAVRQRGSSPKIVPLNLALVHAFRDPAAVDEDADWRGRVFEAAIGAALARTRGELFYWRDGKFEVDYLLVLDGRRYAIEVKSGRRRPMRGLEKFLAGNQGAIPLIVDREKGIELLESQDVDRLLPRLAQS